jgi:hypothetical protein
MERVQMSDKSELALHGALALTEQGEEELATSLAALTETQRRRVLARLGGSTLQEIATAEGCSPSAVDQSLKSPGVKAVQTFLGNHIKVYQKNVTTGEREVIDPIVKMLENVIAIAVNATRSVVVSDGGGVTRVVKVADYPTRLAASVKFLSFVDLEPTRAASPTEISRSAASPAVELEQEETTSTRRRLRVS